MSAKEEDTIRGIVVSFSLSDVQRIRAIEQKTRHDVKAVEYFIRERLRELSLMDFSPYLHFCCTSDDINNLAYALMLKEAITTAWAPRANALIAEVRQLAERTRSHPLLARTHGQPAIPTTLGKELAVFVYRWRRQLEQLQRAEYLAKFNGAVGAYNAHLIADPTAPWEEICRTFVESFGLTFNPLTTQIEPHDYMSEIFHNIIRFNSVTLDFLRDIWLYLAQGYFKQRSTEAEIGSSTMPHKINPIDFENAEGNVELSNALLSHLSLKLPVSRLQRDLSDSTTLRNLGVAIGHSVVALNFALQGLGRIEEDEQELRRDVEAAWETLAEALQVVMRKVGLDDGYESIKRRSQGSQLGEIEYRAIVESLHIAQDEKLRLLRLTPADYTGLAATLVRHIL
jgi:adenylosuccinate lyase